jgi:acidic leucine-rich nuclear phosphoprotein 32 family protein A/C/D
MELLRKTAIVKLERQTSGLDPADVRELSFGDVPLVPAASLAPFRNLCRLSLVSMRPMLTNLFEIPLQHFPHLRVLDASDNRIRDVGVAPPSSDADSSSRMVCVAMRRLALTNNQIASQSTIDALGAVMPQLEVLDLSANPVSSSAPASGYQSKCFAVFAALQVLDGISKEGEEVEVADSDESTSSDESSGADDDDDDDDEEVAEEEEEEDEGPSRKKPRVEQ